MTKRDGPKAIYLKKEARDFAISAHWGQMYGSRPYYYHLDKVAELCEEYNLPYFVQAAAYLHDVVEDTDVTANQVYEKFGYEIATLVYAVTDERSDLDLDKLDAKLCKEHGLKPGNKISEAKRLIRQDKKHKTYPKILAHPYGVHLKLCDRIANVECSLLSKDKNMIEKYTAEAAMFKQKLFTPGVAAPIWKRLDRAVLGKD